MAAIPIRLPPLPGEALDSWLETYAHLLHVAVRDIFALAGVDWDRLTSDDEPQHKLWLYQLDEPDLAALSTVTGIPAATLADMTLARYEGTGLAAVTAAPGLPRTPRWWRQPIGSRYCPRCLAANGGRWMLSWRIPWNFACTGCRVLLADTCPDCGRRHRRARTGQPRRPGCCDLTGLPLPPPRPPRGGIMSCGSDPAQTAAIALPAGGRVLRAQQHTGALTATLLTARGQPGQMAALQQYLDDIHAVARAAISALHGPAAPPAIAVAVLDELGAQPGIPGRPGEHAGIDALTGPAHGRRRQFAPVSAFGVTIADVMLHDRRGDPDPLIAAWLADNEAGRAKTAGPANMLARWDQASPALQAALVKPLASRLDTFYQLRYRALAGPARIPDPARAGEHARALPSLLWPGWALRLMPPEGFDFLRYRFGLGVMLAVASAGVDGYRTAQELFGLQPVHGNRFASFTARLREHRVLEPVAAAICQLARKLDQHGAPVDYARRRRLRRFSRAQLDVTGWRRQRYLLTHPDTWAHRRHLNHADLPAAPVQEHLARLRLIELLTGTHPCYLPEPLRLPERRGPDYAEFVFTLPEPMAGFLHQRASSLLSHAGINEPVTWEPPFGWVTGITWPGPHPGDISPGDLHPLIGSGLPVRAIAARLGTTAEHIRLTAARYPAPQPPASTSAQVAPRQAPNRPGGDIGPHWLREQYQLRQRSLKDIAAETGVPAATLAAAARNTGIPVRHGINGHPHPLASTGAPGAFPPAVWDAFTRPNAEQRIRRLLALPGQPSLHHAARHLGIQHATLASQIRQLEDVTGITLLRAAPDGTITLTANGEQFARDVRPVLESLAQSRSKNASHAP